MPIRILTKKRIEELKKQQENRQVMYDEVEGKTYQQLWLNDLDKFEEEYVKMMKAWEEKNVDEDKNKAGKKKLKVKKV